MKPSCLSCAAALLWLSLPFTATAQPAASAAAPSMAASAAGPAKPVRRLMTPAEQRSSATPPGELQPERPVVPQIRIPLGKTPPPPTATTAARRAATASSPAAIDDAAARCVALQSADARTECLAQLKRPNAKR
ncbi:MAG: hypothetical protein Q7U26_13725 [Aquabacterium sp.]|nr:hypothetical protein [Aquabacterium sp.]